MDKNKYTHLNILFKMVSINEQWFWFVVVSECNILQCIIEIQRNFSLYLFTTRDRNGYIIKLKTIDTLLARNFLCIIVIYLEIKKMVKYNLLYMDIDYNILLMLLLLTMTLNLTKLAFLYLCHSVIFGNSSKDLFNIRLNTNTGMIFFRYTQ